VENKTVITINLTVAHR